jgi:hypothetical protein
MSESYLFDITSYSIAGELLFRITVVSLLSIIVYVSPLKSIAYFLDRYRLNTVNIAREAKMLRMVVPQGVSGSTNEVNGNW